jgi:hypothetical protein
MEQMLRRLRKCLIDSSRAMVPQAGIDTLDRLICVDCHKSVHMETKEKHLRRAGWRCRHTFPFVGWND